MAMALRAGLPLRDMEMVQFHPTGLLAGPGHADDRHGAGGRACAAPAAICSTRPARASCSTTTSAASAPRATSSAAASPTASARATPSPNGGVYISMGHLGPDNVRARVQGHGRALRRLRLRSRRRQGRGDPDRALHDGRRAVQRRLHHRDAGALRGRRGHRRRARRQPARRQRRRQLDGVRRARRRQHGGDVARGEAARRSRPGARSRRRTSAPSRRSAGAAAISKACGGGSIR